MDFIQQAIRARKRMKFVPVLMVVAAMLLLSPAPSVFSVESWEKVADGLDVGRFKVAKETASGDSTFTVVRVDPDYWDLKLLAISETGGDHGMTAREWCEKHKLTAAINAGMFDIDYTTHIGYMKSNEHRRRRLTPGATVCRRFVSTIWTERLWIRCWIGTGAWCRTFV